MYRATVAGGSYVKLTGSLLASPAYTDTTVINGTEYFYVVTASDDSGNESAYSSEVSAIPEYVPNLAPTAVVGGPHSGNVGVAVEFDASASSDPEGLALTYHWDFGDGSTANGVNPSHVYAATGNYTVTLTVNDGFQNSQPVSTTADIGLPIEHLSGRLDQGRLTPDKIYVVTGDVWVSQYSTLTIDPGVEIRFPKADPDGQNRFKLTVTGSLIANGTAAMPIRFTADSGTGCAKDDWTGIESRLSTANVLLDHVIVECAYRGVVVMNIHGEGRITNSLLRNNSTGILSSYNTSYSLHNNTVIDGNTFRGNSVAITVYGRSDARITNNLFEFSRDNILLQGDPGRSADPQPVINGNSLGVSKIYFYYYTNGADIVIDATGNWWGTQSVTSIQNRMFDNNEFAFYPYIDFSGFLDAADGQSVPGNYLYALLEDTELDSNTIYTALGTLLVPPGVTLTLNPGSGIVFPGSHFGLRVEGGLVVQGSDTNPARFSNAGLFRNKSSWLGISLQSGASPVSIDNAIIVDASNGILFNDADGSVSNSSIQGNGTGIRMNGASNPTIGDNNVIKANNIGIHVGRSSTDDPAPIVNNNNIYDNSQYNYFADQYLDPLAVLDATYNWWGEDTDSAAIDAKIFDFNDEPTTSPTVDYQFNYTEPPVEDRVDAPELDDLPAYVNYTPYPVAGSAPAGSTVRLYVEDEFAGSTITNFD
ncbi:MAG: PKD domain-containing protein, partial [Gammaproteobacteria bacterium]|nr:PKD domain-containing protein [Gammaproteobacteria bacterium]